MPTKSKKRKAKMHEFVQVQGGGAMLVDETLP